MKIKPNISHDRALTAALASLRGERDRLLEAELKLRRDFAELSAESGRLIADLDAKLTAADAERLILRDEVRRLRMALAKYGDHLSCDSRFHDDQACSCGFADVLAGSW